MRPHLTLPVIDAQDIVLQSGLQVRYRPAAAAGIDQSLVTASSSLLFLSRVCLARFLLTRVDDAFGHFGLVPCTSAVTSTNCVVVSPGNQALLASHETFVPGPPNWRRACRKNHAGTTASLAIIRARGPWSQRQELVSITSAFGTGCTLAQLHFAPYDSPPQ